MENLKSMTAGGSNDYHLLFAEPYQSDEFKTKVCEPYFKDIYKDLQERSDNKSKGINKISIINYCQLPGLISERLFFVMDKDKNNYLNQEEFLAGFLCFYCSSFDDKIKLIFDIYDFDNDGLIN